jgi:hypothetical protein
MEELERLAVELSNAKVTEAKAKDIRIECEAEICKLVETEDVGSKTVPAGDRMKITVKRSISYKPDMEALLELEGIKLPLTTVPEETIAEHDVFDKKLYEKMLKDPPMGFAKVLDCIVVNQLKPSVTIKLV